MKALEEMNNTERAYLLAKLFPTTLKELTLFIQQEIEHFYKHKDYLQRMWPKSILTANFWFGLVENVEKVIQHHNRSLHKSPRIFADHLFYAHNAIFTIHCLIRYVEKNDCPKPLTQAIHLLFGEEKVIVIDFEEQP